MQSFIDESGLFIFLKFFLSFYAEIQDGRQKWRENDFCKKSPVDSADTLWVKNFVEIALSRSVSETNTFLCLTQKFKMAAKSGGKTFFFLQNNASRLCRYPAGQKFVEIALSRSISEINMFCIYAEIQDGRQKWRENDF